MGAHVELQVGLVRQDPRYADGLPGRADLSAMQKQHHVTPSDITCLICCTGRKHSKLCCSSAFAAGNSHLHHHCCSCSLLLHLCEYTTAVSSCSQTETACELLAMFHVGWYTARPDGLGNCVKTDWCGTCLATGKP